MTLRSGEYIYNNILCAYNEDTTLKYAKKSKNSCELSISQVYHTDEPGTVLTDESFYGKQLKMIPQKLIIPEDSAICNYKTRGFKGWFLQSGVYTIVFNEGVQLGINDVAFITLNDSLIANNIMALSSIIEGRDDFNKHCGRRQIETLQITVDNLRGIYIEQNANVARLFVIDTGDDSPIKLLDARDFINETEKT